MKDKPLFFVGTEKTEFLLIFGSSLLLVFFLIRAYFDTFWSSILLLIIYTVVLLLYLVKSIKVVLFQEQLLQIIYPLSGNSVIISYDLFESVEYRRIYNDGNKIIFRYLDESGQKKTLMFDVSKQQRDFLIPFFESKGHRVKVDE